MIIIAFKYIYIYPWNLNTNFYFAKITIKWMKNYIYLFYILKHL